VSVLPLLAAVLCVVASLLPPEIHPAGRAVVHGLAAASALALAWGAASFPPRAQRAALLYLPLALAALLFVPGGRARGLDEAVAFTGFGLAVLLGRRAASVPPRRLIPCVIAALGTLVAAQAVLQHHWAYPRAAAELRAADAAGAEAYLVRLDQGRPAGPFSLPAALGGFLALSLPMTLAVRRAAGGAALRWGASVALLLQGYALYLTHSIGGLLAATVALALAAAAGAPRPGGAWRTALPAAIAFAALALLFVHGRRAEIGARPGGDPVSLRLGNWEAAVRMIREHPVLGVGPGRFGVFYPRFMRPGMNETQFAHYSYLQIAATWGAWALLPIGLLAAAALRRRPGSLDGAAMAARAAGAGFLAHNFVDFTFFLPGVALPAGLLLGLGSPQPAEQATADASRPAGRRWVAGALLAAALLAHAATVDRAALHLDRARTLALSGDAPAAEREALLSAAAWPVDPDPWAFTAQSLLARGASDSAAALAARAAERAVRLEPDAAILHHTLALVRAVAADPAAAWVEERRAAQLFPGKPLYRTVAAPGPQP